MLKSTLPNWTNDSVMLNSKQVNGFQTEAVRFGKPAEPSGGQTKQCWTRGCPQYFSSKKFLTDKKLTYMIMGVFIQQFYTGCIKRQIWFKINFSIQFSTRIHWTFKVLLEKWAFEFYFIYQQEVPPSSKKTFIPMQWNLYSRTF